jgi:hypothetical protein
MCNLQGLRAGAFKLWINCSFNCQTVKVYANSIKSFHVMNPPHHFNSKTQP